jgi:hypothetical protein
MLDLPGHPILDKASLVGVCARLALTFDAARLQSEVEALPAQVWDGTDGRVGVHRAAGAVFLRGYAPAEGPRPIEDRAALAALPYAREIIEHLVPAPALRCLLARLPAGGTVGTHVDRAPYFAKSLRLHFPVQTHEHAWMVCAGRCYLMAAGEVWALNNSTLHGVWNADASRARTHMICDFLPTPELLALLRSADRDLAQQRPDVLGHLAASANAPRGIPAG